MFLRKSAGIFVIVSIVAAMLIITSVAWGESVTSRSDILRQLTHTAPSRMPGRVAALASNLPDECAQLSLDLLIYRWRLHKENLRTDIPNLDIIISTLQSTLNDQMVNWTAQEFTIDKSQNQVMRPSGDNRADTVTSLKAEFEAALEDKDSYPIRAVSSLGNVASLCQNLSLDICEACVCKDMGDHYLYDMASYRQAESFYNAASRIFQVYGCAASSARLHNDWGFLCMTIGKYTDAAEHHLQSARQWEQLVREDPRGYKYRDMAGSQYIMAGKAKDAAGDCAGALDLMIVNGLSQLRNYAYSTKSYATLVTNQITVAIFLREQQDDINRALTLLKEAQIAAKSEGDLLLIARVYDELAKTYAAKGESYNNHAAATKRDQALKDAGVAGESAVAKWAKTGVVSDTQNRDMLLRSERGAKAFQELGQFARSANLWRKTAGLCGMAKMTDDQLRCLQSLASTQDSQSLTNDALKIRFEAIALAKKSGRYSAAADIVMAVIQAFRDQNDIQNALEGLKELEAIVANVGNGRQIAEVLESRGDLLASLGQYDEAATDFQASVDKYLNQVGDVWAAGQVSLKQSSALQAKKHLQEATVAVAEVLKRIESSYGSESFRSATFQDHSRILMDIYLDIVSGYVRSDRENEAGDLIIKAKARRYPWMPDMIAKLRSDSEPKVAKFAATSEILRQASDPVDPTSIRMLVATDPADYVRACWKLRQDYPSSYDSLPIEPIALYKSRSSIPKDSVVIEYMATESSLYAFICGRDRTICRQLSDGSVRQLVAKLRKTLEYCEQGLSAGVPIPPVTDWRSPAFVEIKEPLAGLYSCLLTPLIADLQGQQQIVFALPSELASVPMQALVTEDEDGTPRFLIQNYQISYLAKGMLDDLTSDQSRAIVPSVDALAIFADPEDNLPGAKKEAANIKNAYLNSRWYVGKEKATATNFISELSQAGLLHIAAHHKIDSIPSGFELILAGDGASDGAIGIKHFSAIVNPALQLVVLSACDTVGSADPTSTGPAQAVEMFSLAGAKSVLGAMWKVSDDAASQVFTDFYRNLNRGKSRAEALRLAQLSMVESKQFAHPFYWGCFALYGNPR